MKRWTILIAALMCICFQGSPIYSDLWETSEDRTTANSSAILPYTSSNDEVVSVKMIPEAKAISIGKPFWICFQLDIAPEWHLYWKNPGEIGSAPSIKWTLPDGFHAGDILWPTPERIEIDHSILFGYSHQLNLLVPIYPPEVLSSKAIDFKADLEWLGCSTTCVPGEAFFSLSLPVKDKEVAPDKKVTTLFKNAHNSLPLNGKEVRSSLQETDSQIEIEIPGEIPFFNVNRVLFFPEEKDLFDLDLIPSWSVKNKGHLLTVTVPSKKVAVNKLSLPVKAVIVVEKNDNEKIAWNISIPSQSSTEQEQKSESSSYIDALEKQIWYRQLLSSVSEFIHSDFFKILLLAFFGGIILNVMPCVLPVISLKLLHFVQLKEHDKKAVTKHGLSYLLGVLVAFWGLVGTIYLLQAFGRTVGWGFQLQEPVFVAALLIILFIFSLSLFGIFEFFPSLSSIAGQWQQTFRMTEDTSTQMPSYIASFLSGILAAFVASPCTGPLLGSAIGFAATLEPIYSFAIFSSLAIGLAFPFLLVAFIPGASRLIPRPGAWMVAFKHLMGFFMLATCLWLAWVLDAETRGLSGMTILITLYIIGFGMWVYGTWGGLNRSRRVRLTARIITLSIVAYGSYVLIANVQKTRALPQLQELSVKTSSQIVGKDWEPFSTVLLERVIKQKLPVFVLGTAKWCLTCQTNHVVLESDRVKNAFIQYGVVKLEADWTNGDEYITKYIRSLGRNGVPLAVVYSRNPKEPPRILPEVLTPDIVCEALQWAQEERPENK